MNNDLISREALLKEVRENKELFEKERVYLEGLLLNAPAVDTSDDKYLEERDADAYESGYLQGHIDGYLKAEKDYARPQGEWYYNYLYGWHCSICNKSVKDMPTDNHRAVFNFCPNCGADMRGGAE